MNKRKLYPIWFAAGALIVYSVLFVLPSIIGVCYSFTDWSSYSEHINFVGLANYKVIFSADEDYIKIISNTISFTLITTFLDLRWHCSCPSLSKRLIFIEV